MSFQAFPGRNLGRVLALILIFSPVAGLTPVLADLLTFVKVPNPTKETSLPFLTDFLIVSSMLFTKASASFLVRWLSSLDFKIASIK